MGILNLTPDSFYDGGRHNSGDAALFHVEKMLNEGAAFIDIGAQSTRPNANDIGTNEELRRAIPIIENIIKRFPEAVISIDTFRAEVAEKALGAGASMVNDVSAGDDDPKMFDVIIKHKVPYILMHKQGSPKNMQKEPHYTNVVLDIINYFIPKIEYLHKQGVSDLMIDPGFGFGKTLEHNYELLNGLDSFKIFELPVLVGVSRKTMIQKVAGTDVAGALNATTAAHAIALMKGAKILRVHDVKEAVEAVKIYDRVVGSDKGQEG